MCVARIPFNGRDWVFPTLQGYFGTYVAKSNLKMPALELLREIELEDGSRDSLLRALDYRQGCCTSKQAELDKILDTIESGPPSVGPLVWDRRLDVGRPWTYMPSLWMLKEYKLKVGPSEVSRCLARTHSETSLLKLPLCNAKALCRPLLHAVAQ